MAAQASPEHAFAPVVYIGPERVRRDEAFTAWRAAWSVFEDLVWRLGAPRIDYIEARARTARVLFSEQGSHSLKVPMGGRDHAGIARVTNRVLLEGIIPFAGLTAATGVDIQSKADFDHARTMLSPQELRALISSYTVSHTPSLAKPGRNPGPGVSHGSRSTRVDRPPSASSGEQQWRVRHVRVEIGELHWAIEKLRDVENDTLLPSATTRSLGRSAIGAPPNSPEPDPGAA